MVMPRRLRGANGPRREWSRREGQQDDVRGLEGARARLVAKGPAWPERLPEGVVAW